MTSDCECGPFYLLTLTCRLSEGEVAREVLRGLELQKNVSDPPLYRRETVPGLFSQRTGHVTGMKETKIFIEYCYKICWKTVTSNAEIIEE
jgi:hypothetical protein